MNKTDKELVFARMRAMHLGQTQRIDRVKSVVRLKPATAKSRFFIPGFTRKRNIFVRMFLFVRKLITKKEYNKYVF